MKDAKRKIVGADEKDPSEWRRQVETLERRLQRELGAKELLERELREIKDSLAWTLVLKFRRLSNRLLAEGTFRHKVYGFVRDVIKILILSRGPIPVLNIQQLPRLAMKALRIVKTEGFNSLRQRLGSKIEVAQEYSRWVEPYDVITDTDRAAITRHLEPLPYKPLISVVMPVYNTPEKWLRLAIESVRKQLYPNWELCIADDASSSPHVRDILQGYQARDARIRVVFRKDNGHISAASNSALDMVRGDFIALLDHDDELSEHALYMVAVELNAHSDADLIYSDEDKIDEKGQRHEPYFKPDWNPDLFLCQNYFSHLGVYRTAIVREIGGFRAGYEGAQDWDLAMRASEVCPPARIRHIPHVLYHWRTIRGSAALAIEEKNYAREAQRKTIESHFERIGLEVTVLPQARVYWRIKYPLSVAPLVTLIIPTRNGYDLLHRCVESIFHKTAYSNFELIIVDNQSDDSETLHYLAQLERQRGVRLLAYDAPFNYAAINNFAVQHARGKIVGLMNNDLEVITPDWLEEMVSQALRAEIGAVGAMLYYPNNTIQHCGVILGWGGVAGHVYKHRPRGYPGQASRALLCQNLSAVTAACLVVRRQVFEEVGGFDETNLAVAFNDVDLCLRIEEKGYRNLWTPYAEFYHYESASRGCEDTQEKIECFEKECNYMKRRWGELLANDPAYSRNLALDTQSVSLAFPPRVQKPWLVEASHGSASR